MNWTETFKMNCRQASFLQGKKKEGAISLSERLGLRIHLIYCSFCRLFFSQIDQLERSAKELADKSVPLDPSAKANMERAFEAEMKK